MSLLSASGTVTAISLLILGLAYSTPAVAEDQGPSVCRETMTYAGTFHRFGGAGGGGPCYIGDPGAVHAEWEPGYCFEYHTSC